MLRPPPRSTLFPYTTLFRSNNAHTREVKTTKGVDSITKVNCCAFASLTRDESEFKRDAMSTNLVAPRSLQELTERLQESFSEMAPQFQIGARYLLDNPSEVPVSSMRKIAQQAGVQPATLVRLAQSLGHEGWTGLNVVFVHSLHAGDHAYALQARKGVRQRHRPDRVAKAVEAQAHNVQKLSELNTGRLSKAVDILVKARRVYVAGFRASYASAFTFHYLYR